MSASENFVEEISDSEHQHQEHVHGPNCSHGHEDEHLHANVVLNRNEQKARADIIKLGLKPVLGIHRVTFVRGKMVFAISEPEIYKNPIGDTYIVFGEARVEDPGFQAQIAAAQKLINESAANNQNDYNKSTIADVAAQAIAAQANQVHKNNEEDEDEEEEDSTGLNELDIKIVMEQANVSRNKAISALKEHDNDVVNTIMELSM